MGVFKNIKDVARIVATGAEDVTEEIADAGRKFYCNLYSNSPYWAMAKNTIIVPIVTRTLDNFCSDTPPPPPPPDPGYTGGQCLFAYNIQITYTYIRPFSTETDTRTETVKLNQSGAITSLAGIITNDDDSIRTLASINGEPEINLGNTSQAGVGEIVDGSWFWTVTPANGQPDVCGNPPNSGYPPIAPPEPSDLTGDVTIINNNGDSVDYNVTVNPDITGTVVFPPVINVGGVSVTIDVGGISINKISNKFSGGGSGGQGETFTDTSEPEEEEEKETELPEDEGGDEKTVEKLIAVTISLTQIPDNADVTGGNGSPNVYYAGWVEFKNKGTFYGRQYINFQSTRFNAPEENDGYAVFFRDGFAGIVTEITIDEVE